MKYNKVFYYRYEPNISGGKTIIINGDTGEVYRTSLLGCKILDCVSENNNYTVDEVAERLKIKSTICKNFLKKLVEVSIIQEDESLEQLQGTFS